MSSFYQVTRRLLLLCSREIPDIEHAARITLPNRELNVRYTTGGGLTELFTFKRSPHRPKLLIPAAPSKRASYPC